MMAELHCSKPVFRSTSADYQEYELHALLDCAWHAAAPACYWPTSSFCHVTCKCRWSSWHLPWRQRADRYTRVSGVPAGATGSCCTLRNPSWFGTIRNGSMCVCGRSCFWIHAFIMTLQTWSLSKRNILQQHTCGGVCSDTQRLVQWHVWHVFAWDARRDSKVRSQPASRFYVGRLLQLAWESFKLITPTTAHKALQYNWRLRQHWPNLWW